VTKVVELDILLAMRFSGVADLIYSMFNGECERGY